MFWEAITIIGDPILLFFCMIIIAIYASKFKGRKAVAVRRFMLFAVPAMLVTILAVEGIKGATAIERQCVVCPADGCNPYCPKSYSFPSSHAAGVTTLIACVCLFTSDKRYLSLFVFPFLVAYSRIALGVHTYQDVAVGLMMGACIPAVIWIFRNDVSAFMERVL